MMKIKKLARLKELRSLNISPWIICLLTFLSPIPFLSLFVIYYFYGDATTPKKLDNDSVPFFYLLVGGFINFSWYMILIK